MSFEHWIGFVSFIIGLGLGGFVAWKYIDKAVRLCRIDCIESPVGFKVASGALFLAIAGIVGFIGIILVQVAIYLAIIAGVLYAIFAFLSSMHESEKTPQQHEARFTSEQEALEREARNQRATALINLNDHESEIEELEESLGVRINAEDGIIEHFVDGAWVTHRDASGMRMRVDITGGAHNGMIFTETTKVIGTNWAYKKYTWESDPSLEAYRKVNEDGSITTERELTGGEKVAAVLTGGFSLVVAGDEIINDTPSNLGDAYKLAMQRQEITKARGELEES